MEEHVTEGIVVGTEDSGEADKLVRLLTPDLGVITARMRGVKKEKAKLKFAAMPFSFCQYVLMRRGQFYTVKTASQEESLFAVTFAPDRYIVGTVMLEVSSVMAGSDSAEVFIDLLTCLKALIYSSVSPRSIGLNFVYRALVRGGYVAPTSLEADFNVPDEEQSSLEDARAGRLLKAYLSLAEKKLGVTFRSAPLLA